MRVVLNRTTALRRRAGIGHYASQLEKTLRLQFAKGDDLLLFPGRWTARALGVFDCWKRPKNNDAGAGQGGPARANRGRDLLALSFRAFTALRSFDLYHEPNTIPLPCDRPTVTTVHDLSPLLHPEWHPAERVAHFERHFQAGLERSSRLITSSHAVRRELTRHCGMPADKITTIPFGIRAEFRPLPSQTVVPILRRLNLPTRFFLAVGTLEPRKNLMTLMRAFCRLPIDVRERTPLVLAGGWGWNTAELAAYLHDEARHRGVIHLGYVDDADLPALYNAALGLCFPTHYEGFGLPAIEMMACGGLVLASTADALRELVPRSWPVIAPLDEDGWHAALLRLATDDAWRHSLRSGAREHVADLTWLRCAEATWSVFRQVLGLEPATTKSIRVAA